MIFYLIVIFICLNLGLRILRSFTLQLYLVLNRLNLWFWILNLFDGFDRFWVLRSFSLYFNRLFGWYSLGLEILNNLWRFFWLNFNRLSLNCLKFQFRRNSNCFYLRLRILRLFVSFSWLDLYFWILGFVLFFLYYIYFLLNFLIIFIRFFLVLADFLIDLNTFFNNFLLRFDLILLLFLSLFIYLYLNLYFYLFTHC